MRITAYSRAVLLIAFFALVVAGCDSGDSTGTTEAPSSAADASNAVDQFATNPAQQTAAATQVGGSNTLASNEGGNAATEVGDQFAQAATANLSRPQAASTTNAASRLTGEMAETPMSGSMAGSGLGSAGSASSGTGLSSLGSVSTPPASLDSSGDSGGSAGANAALAGGDAGGSAYGSSGASDGFGSAAGFGGLLDGDGSGVPGQKGNSVVDLARNPASASGAAGSASGAKSLTKGSPMGSEDPANYFALLDPEESLFKIVARRYTAQAQAWMLSDAERIGRSVTAGRR